MRCSKLEQRLVEFECSINNLEQHGKRNNVIISGIPDSLNVNQLEESATEILIDINVNVADNVESCHRIDKKDTRIGSTKTIICFVNRRHAKQALHNKNKFSQVKKKYIFNPNNNPFFISENLARMNESLAYQGRKLNIKILQMLAMQEMVLLQLKLMNLLRPLKVII